jgi:dTDP-4-amino-4,6-dideoxygalactose transaminase
LEARGEIQARRQHIWEYYYQHLDVWASENSIQMPVVPPYCEQPYHMFYLILPSLEYRQALISHLKSCGILSVFHYLPLHLSNMGRSYGGKEGDCPVTEKVSDLLLRLPFYNDLTEEDQARVISAIKDFIPSKRFQS